MKNCKTANLLEEEKKEEEEPENYDSRDEGLVKIPRPEGSIQYWGGSKEKAIPEMIKVFKASLEFLD